MDSPVARILVVDDDEATLDMLAGLLSHEGYEVLAALDAVTALTLIDQSPPDLILTDWAMPILDGAAFVAAYQASPAHRPHAPIIVVTAEWRIESVRAARGVAGIIAKPFELDELLYMVEKHLWESRRPMCNRADA